MSINITARRCKRLCSKVCHATEEEAVQVAEIMARRWNRRGRRDQVMRPVYCALCRSWHVTSDPYTPPKNEQHSAAMRQWRQQAVNAKFIRV